jgi:hypothetical protein
MKEGVIGEVLLVRGIEKRSGVAAMATLKGWVSISDSTRRQTTW